MNRRNPEEELRELLRDSLTRHRVAGASMAVFHEGQVFAAAEGVANVASGVALTPDTLMHIGSITKLFSTTLIMQLVESKHLALDDPVCRHLPNLKLKAPGHAERLTVRMLLNHTSGIDTGTPPDRGHDQETIENGVASLSARGCIHSPGAEFSYSNEGTMIAGYLAQRVAGESWYSLVRSKILEPLGMRHAATLPEEAVLHRVSIGHHLDPKSNALRPVKTAFLPLSRSPSGASLMMSPADLITFAVAHMKLGMAPSGARILSEAGCHAMRQVSMENSGKGYAFLDMGLGWMLGEGGLLHHGGSSPGAGALLFVYPNRSLAIALAVNTVNFDLLERLLRPWLDLAGNTKLLGILPDISVPLRTQAVKASKYVGVYENAAYRFRVFDTSDGLVVTRQAKFAWFEDVATEESPPEKLTPLGNDQFLLAHGGEKPVRVPAGFGIHAFRNPDSSGQMRHLGWSGILYARVA